MDSLQGGHEGSQPPHAWPKGLQCSNFHVVNQAVKRPHRYIGPLRFPSSTSLEIMGIQSSLKVHRTCYVFYNCCVTLLP